jgi:hypothetical protein
MTIISLLYFIPSTPYLPPYLDAERIVSSATIFDSRLLNPNWCYSSNDVVLDIHKCKDCSKSEYIVSTSAYNSKAFDPEFVTEDINKATEFVKNLKFCPMCPGIEHSWNVKIIRKDYFGNATVENVM